MRIGLIPLDERPVNTRFPAMVTAGAGVTLVQPPLQLLSMRRRPGNSAALAAWLHEVAPTLDGVVISCDQLGYGGMIAARTSHIPPAAVLERLETLRTLRVRYPQLPIFGFSHIMRVSPGSDLFEEPSYWSEFGRDLYRFSVLVDAERSARASAQDIAELATLTDRIPAQIRRDMLVRRLRNHMVHQGLLHMVSDDIFDLLVISVDDSDGSLAARERRWLADWAALLADDHRLLVYPAGDELAAMLIVRMLLQLQQRTATVAIGTFGNAADLSRLEDTLAQQLRVLGLTAVDSDCAEIRLILNQTVCTTGVGCSAAVQLSEAVLRGQLVALVDLAIPSGGDSLLVRSLAASFDLRRLSGFCAWESPGSSIGCALLQAVSRLLGGPAQREAQQQLLLHRLLEDYGYRALVVHELRHWLRQRFQADEPVNSAIQAQYCLRTEQALNTVISSLNGFARQFELVPASLQLPWRRTNEIDFELRALTALDVNERIDALVS